ncbi:MAG: DUF3990 domain-containing protein [Bacteroidaceae bacterium]|nr:DUF3990 domain-containing protein [Bacteroidaceae bacterium]
MKLYHGTNYDIDTINLTAGKRFKDFGQGFYLTPNKATAERMARKKAKMFGGEPLILEYEFNAEQAEEIKLKMKKFPEKANAEWIRFIDRNRDRHSGATPHQYDIVTGPIADDGVVVQLTNYKNEILTPEEAASRLQDKYLDQQYYFGTPKALELLKKTHVWKIN